MGPSPGTHQFCLKWNNHSSNLLKVFSRLLFNESFTDVTLAAEGRSIRAHKMVLSACSTYFEQLFLEHPEPNPIVIMRETSYVDLAAIVEFIYKGEINVSQDQLGSLLRTAESLRVKGLAQVSSGSHGNSTENGENHPSPPFTPPTHPSLPPPALLPLFQSMLQQQQQQIDDSSDVPLRKRPKMFDFATSPSHQNDEVATSTPFFAPRKVRNNSAEVSSVSEEAHHPHHHHVVQQQQQQQQLHHHHPAALDLRLPDLSGQPVSDKPIAEMPNLNLNIESEALRRVMQDKSEPGSYFRGLAVYKFNDYIAHGTRQQYWEEPFTKAVMAGIHDRELDLKKGAEMLGVSYSTLYGRYRESHGYLRHAWTRVRDRNNDTWWDGDKCSGDFSGEMRRGETESSSTEEVVVEVDSFDVINESNDNSNDKKDTKDSLILSIKHGKVQRRESLQN